MMAMMAIFELLLVLCTVGAAIGQATTVACPYVCHCDAALMSVDCSRTGLTRVPVEEIANNTKYLAFDGNSMGWVPEGTFSRYRLWLRALSLADNQLEWISERTFRQLARLKRLDVSDNLLAALPMGGFYGTSSLLWLDLSGNYLHDIPSETFLGLTTLEELNLNSNAIKCFKEDSFSGLSSLRRLWLAGNLLHVDPVAWFSMNSKLEELDLSGNRIPLVADVREWFHPGHTVRLRFLSLANNNIKILPRGVFRGLGHLEHLDLGTNALVSIKECDFRGLHSLTVLKLQKNSIYALHEMSLGSLSNLSHLDLDGNQLASLPSNLFTPFRGPGSQDFSRTNYVSPNLSDFSRTYNNPNDLDYYLNGPRALTSLKVGNNLLGNVPGIRSLRRLQILDLSNNQLGRLSLDAFLHNGDLREIRLNGNSLAIVGYASFARLRLLRRLDLSGNPWRCDCRLEWIQELARSDRQPVWAAGLADGIICTHPLILRGQCLRDADSQLIREQCPRLAVGLAMSVVITTWLASLGVLVACFWAHRCLRVRKFDRDRKSNFRYHRKRKLGRRRHGIAAGQTCSVTTKVSQRRTAFPLQAKGHTSHEVTYCERDYTQSAKVGRKVIATYL